MDVKKILSMVDHTCLSQSATWKKIKQICDEGMKFETASVCIPPSFVRRASEYVGGKLKICTVVGFPNGYNTTETKIFETKDAISNGANEIDMVVNLGFIKDEKYAEQLDEIKKIKVLCQEKVLKVIIETCFLSDDEKKKMCEIVTKSEADFIKTSTGFAEKGATFEDVALLKKYVGPSVGVKAAGGIKSFDDAEKFIELGASRLGTSKLIGG